MPRGTAGVDAATLSHALATGITEAVRPALLLAAGLRGRRGVPVAAAPRTPPITGDHEPLIEALVAIEPVEPDPAVVLSREG